MNSMPHMLRDYHTVFVDELKKRKKAQSTLLAYGSDAKQIIAFLEKRDLTDPARVTRADIEAYTKELKAKRYTDKSIVRKINSAKAFFTFLQELSAIEHNPVSNVEKPKYETVAPRILTKMEYRALRDACRVDRRIAAIVEVLLQTGMRISELAFLKLNDFDPKTNMLTIRNPENGAVRTVPINNAAALSIADYLKTRPKTREKALFITKTCKPFLVRNIRAAIDRYFKFAGIKDAKVNDLRHTFIVEQLAAGTPLVHVNKLVGHRRLTTTEKYLEFLQKNADFSAVRIEEL